jgi:hypothetical protein
MACRRCTKKKLKKPKIKVNRGIVNPRKIEGPRDRSDVVVLVGRQGLDHGPHGLLLGQGARQEDPGRQEKPLEHSGVPIPVGP